MSDLNELVDWERMELHTSDNIIKSVQMVDGRRGYNGRAEFIDLRENTILLTESYKNYNFLDITVGDYFGQYFDVTTLSVDGLIIGDENAYGVCNIISGVTSMAVGKNSEWWVDIGLSTYTDWVGYYSRNATIISIIGRN